MKLLLTAASPLLLPAATGAGHVVLHLGRKFLCIVMCSTHCTVHCVYIVQDSVGCVQQGFNSIEAHSFWHLPPPRGHRPNSTGIFLEHGSQQVAEESYYKEACSFNGMASFSCSSGVNILTIGARTSDADADTDTDIDTDTDTDLLSVPVGTQ